MRLEVPPVKARELAARRVSLLRDETDAARARVLAARERQKARAARLGVAATNARLTPAELERAAALDDAARRVLAAGVAEFGLSARAYHRAWRLARTVADLNGEESVGVGPIAEALSMRGVG